MGSFNKQVDCPVMTGESSFSLSNQSIEQSRSTINANLPLLADLEMLELKNMDKDFTFIGTIGIADLAANPEIATTYPEFHNFITHHNPSCHDPSSFDGYVMEETLEAPSVEKYRKLFNEMLHLMYFNCHLTHVNEQRKAESSELLDKINTLRMLIDSSVSTAQKVKDDGSEMQKEFRGVYPYKSKIDDTQEGCDSIEVKYNCGELQIVRTPTVVGSSMQTPPPKNYEGDGHFEHLQVESIKKEGTPVADVTHSRRSTSSRSLTRPKHTYAPYKKNPTRRLINELCQVSADTPIKQIAAGLSNLSVSPLVPINKEINHHGLPIHNTYERSPFAPVSPPNSSHSGTNSKTDNSANDRRQRSVYSPDSNNSESH
ncbi:hypothetical protein GCK72_026280 [Caenorhabditis remanei]|uniref:Uncharacterized protein n=1 Tax=Caenorhabditis remanei TaxID=31234 RepID=A0A6A5G4E7_CAERE|nr:hypothetical protein GCK72_026275 [Caenorhabditis remanei]XP_053580367.1 hypothetical protein GCK72_026280 [Caenorhabditis remanei]KAF1749806.1 hypothetical protein GCK72_026275 [Caenorhabditis remanei]KAF1749811.1 hypothetical protein GCK72_026280 [Caenorhabditis remanei]